MPDDLLTRINDLAELRGDSRAALIREACGAYVKKLREEAAAAEYVRSFEQLPETQEEREWAEAAEQLAAEVLGEEDWEDEYRAFVKAEGKLRKKSA
jgi:predicted DNA-binding protein